MSCFLLAISSHPGTTPRASSSGCSHPERARSRAHGNFRKTRRQSGGFTFGLIRRHFRGCRRQFPVFGDIAGVFAASSESAPTLSELIPIRSAISATTPQVSPLNVSVTLVGDASGSVGDRFRHLSARSEVSATPPEASEVSATVADTPRSVGGTLDRFKSVIDTSERVDKCRNLSATLPGV